MNNREFKPGQTVVWIGDTIFCLGETLIKQGEKRKIVEVCKDGKLWLTGRSGYGLYGRTDPQNVRVISCQETGC